MKQKRRRQMDATSGFISSEHSSDQEGFQEERLQVSSRRLMQDDSPLLISVRKIYRINCQDDAKSADEVSLQRRSMLPAELDRASMRNSEQFEVSLMKPPHKQKKFRCLRDKYMDNPSFRLLYSKFGPISPDDYLYSYLNLNQTVDFNPSHYYNLLPAVDQPEVAEPTFDSRFESGNLLYTYWVSQAEYDLILHNDFNTKGYNQWFFFSFKNHHLTHVKLNIVNLVKRKSMFTEGVRPVCFSHLNKQDGWTSVGSNINYYKSLVYRQNGEHYYTLSFQLSNISINDTLYIGLNIPYTYSRMVSMISSLPTYDGISVENNILCYSISNNAIPQLHIKATQGQNKRQIVVLARQHPGETVSSFLMEAFLQQLISDKGIHILRNFDFIILPMLNPDGVIYGNFRTNLAGFDLNRQWLEPNRWMHPEVYFAKKMINSLDRLAFVLDLHGHSKKFNSFIYACKQQDPIMQKYFPYLMQQSPVFSLKDCTYGITLDKTKTARATIFNSGTHQVYTVQTSFYGYCKNQKAFRLSNLEFQQLAQTLLESVDKFFSTNQTERKRVEVEIGNKMWQFQQWEVTNNDDSGSQSNPSEDELTPFERKQKVMSEAVRNRKVSGRRRKKKKKKSVLVVNKQQHEQSVLRGINAKDLTKTTYDKSQILPKTNFNKQFHPVKDSLGRKTLFKDESQEDTLNHQQHAETSIKFRSGLFRKEAKKSFLPMTHQERKPKKSVSNLLQEPFSQPKKQNLTVSKKLDEITQPILSREEEDEPRQVSAPNRLLLEYSRKMQTRDKLETLLNSNRIEDRVNINIGKAVKKEIQISLQTAREDFKRLDNHTKAGVKNLEMPSISGYTEDPNIVTTQIRKIRDVDNRRARSLKGSQKLTPARKQHVYLSELMKPKVVEDNRVICLKIEQDIYKQMKMRSNSIKEKHIFIDYRFHY